MSPMMKSLALLIAGGVALLAARSAQAGVVWNLYETSCTSFSTTPCDIPQGLPLLVGHLALPSLYDSGTYYYSSLTLPPVESGDTNFSFIYNNNDDIPVINGRCGPGPCQIDLNFTSSLSGLSLRLSYNDQLDSFSPLYANGFSWGGNVGSDDSMIGCGEFLACAVTGYLTLTSTPEPSSLLTLASADLGVFLIMLRRGGVGADWIKSWLRAKFREMPARNLTARI